MRVLPALLMITLPLAASGKRPTAAQLQVQVKKLTAERDDLKARLAALDDVQEDLAAAKQARDQAKADAAASQKQLEEVKATLKENQSGGDTLLKDLESARKAAATAQKQVEKLTQENQTLRQQVAATPQEGDLVMLTADVIPARAINLNRVTPRIPSKGLFESHPKGVVVVNVLVSEKGEVLDARLLQGLPGEPAEVQSANEACVQAAKTLVFDPATSKDGSVRYKVWQGVGFYLD